MQTVNHFINNEFVPSSDGETLPGVNPATEETFYRLANGTQADVDKAYKAASSAYPYWRQTLVDERMHALNKMAFLIDKRAEALAELESIDNGKPKALARSLDIPRAAANFRFYANAISQFSSEAYSNKDEVLNYTLNQPLGVVACISPWNLPLYLLTWKIAPALATGNTVIAKPSELTPLTANALAEIALEAGLPKGVLNIMHGEGPKVGEALINHPGIQAVSFTGGTKTGRHIAKACAQLLRKVSLELGGKNAAMVFADCDFDKTVDTLVKSSFTNQGEVCLASSRLFIEESLYDQFIESFIAKVSALTVGDPLAKESFMGALISSQHLEKVSHFVDEAKGQGATVLCGGEALKVNGKGYFYQPTVLSGLDNQARINQEEVFGPVVTLQRFKDETDLITRVNDSPYGLSATIYTTELTRAHRLSRLTETGIVWINNWLVRDLRTPFGGIKQSGLGREGGLDALHFFTEKKNICLQF